MLQRLYRLTGDMVSCVISKRYMQSKKKPVDCKSEKVPKKFEFLKRSRNSTVYG